MTACLRNTLGVGLLSDRYNLCHNLQLADTEMFTRL